MAFVHQEQRTCITSSHAAEEDPTASDDTGMLVLVLWNIDALVIFLMLRL